MNKKNSHKKIQELISKTEDYQVFETSLNETVSVWEEQLQWKKINKNFKLDSKHNLFYLFGTPGSGKTEYLNIWKGRASKRIKKKIKVINKLEEISAENNKIYLFDAFNEARKLSRSFVMRLKIILKKAKCFVLITLESPYLKIPYTDHHWINPSEDALKNGNWEKIKKIIKHWADDFSMREKYLMSTVKNIERISNKEPDSIIWKAFENNFSNEEEKKYYKKLASISPFDISKKYVVDVEFKSLLKKNLIFECNNNFKFTHPQIASFLFLRACLKEYRTQIKNFHFRKTKEHYVANIIEKIIKRYPTSYIHWWLPLNKNSNQIATNKLLSFFKKNKIKISVRDHKLIDSNVSDSDIEYLPLEFSDSKILSEKGKYQRIYNEYLNENIYGFNILEENPYTEVDLKDDLIYFIHLIFTPLVEMTPPLSIKSIRKTNFHKEIKWKNDTNRQKMLNFILARYVQEFVDEKFSALKISRLKKVLFVKWDEENAMNFSEYINYHKNSLKKSLGKNPSIKTIENFYKFFKFIDAQGAPGTSKKLLDFYKQCDSRCKSLRRENSVKKIELEYKIIAYSLFLLFEKNYTYYSEIKRFRFSTTFIKFILLLLERVVHICLSFKF